MTHEHDTIHKRASERRSKSTTLEWIQSRKRRPREPVCVDQSTVSST